MQQQRDYTSAPYHPYYHLFPNPNPNPNPNSDHVPTSFPSAPPFNSGYVPNDYSSYSQNPDPVTVHVSPSAPPYTPPVNPNLQSFNSASQATPYQPLTQQQSYFPTYSQHQTAPNYAPPPPSVPSNPSPALNSQYSSIYSPSYGQSGALVPPVYDNPYENSVKYDQGSGYLDNRYGDYSQRPWSDVESDLYGKRYDSGRDDEFVGGVYAYQGNKVEPYGSRGTAPNKSSTLFDDYGRAISFSSSKDSSCSSSKIVREVPKAEIQQDVKSGLQKFRVKLLAESGGQSTTDVLCQVMDSSTLAFWSKSSVDIETKRTRLQSNSYTTSILLDIVTAATVQGKEMGGSIMPSKSFKLNEQSTEKKKGFTDWINLVKPVNEEKDHWVPDEAVTKCTSCRTDFGAFVRKHHCRNCGDIFCDKCTQGRTALTADENAQSVRVCDQCMAEVIQRLNNA
jgi:hypothetical protein